VAQTLGPVVVERFAALKAKYRSESPAGSKKLFETDFETQPADNWNKAQTKALIRFWQEWQDELATIRILDPACGSGAFLIESFNQLHLEYDTANGRLRDLGEVSLFDPDQRILQQNLYGVDLNEEAIEICRLSLWIKTAKHGQKLTSLDHTIRVGNSVVSEPAYDPEKAFNWERAFPEVTAVGGFDVVVGNPPYIRQEWIAPYKQHWKAVFDSFNSVADIFTYFYELGVKRLRQGGRLGFITSGSWVRGNFGSGIRSFLAKNARIESMVDFGEYQPFEDAEMIRPSIVILRKAEPGGSMSLFKWLSAGEPPKNLSDVIRAAPTMSTDHLGEATWELDSDDVQTLRQKLSSRGTRLTDYTKGTILYGIKTGLNEVFVIDSAKRADLINAHPNSADIIKPLIQGTHLRPWYIENSSEFIIFARRGININLYPAIREYLEAHRKELEPRPLKWLGKEWPGRKPGAYRWYELQDTVDYWMRFEEPKIVWPDISKLPRFSMDLENRYLGNTGYVIPGGDYYLLAVLSTWATWFFISKTAQPLRLREGRWQYRLIAQFMENVPIPDAADSERTTVADLARRASELGTQRYLLETHVQKRLTDLFGANSRGDVEGKLNQKAEEWWEQTFAQLGTALKASFKLSKSPFHSPKVADDWEPYIRDKKAERDALKKQLASAEAEINDRVYRLFKLTKDEIALLQREVEH
jgi:hypothetical protein